MTWKVYYFQTKSGRKPVKEFIQSQNTRTRSRIQKSLILLSKSGPFLKPPYIKKLMAKLYELRINEQISIKIFYSPKNDSYYLLHAFKKKTQNTPPRELKTAIDRMKQLI
jgi:phage-related protein